MSGLLVYLHTLFFKCRKATLFFLGRYSTTCWKCGTSIFIRIVWLPWQICQVSSRISIHMLLRESSHCLRPLQENIQDWWMGFRLLVELPSKTFHNSYESFWIDRIDSHNKGKCFLLWEAIFQMLRSSLNFYSFKPKS